MKWLIILLALLFSVHGSPDTEKIDLPDIIHKIQNFFTFLCTRCKEVVSVIDWAIDSQSLMKDANALCDAMLGSNDVMQRVCKSVVEDILGEVYTQLKKLEPDDRVCAHLHLCDACLVPTFSTETATSLSRAQAIHEIDTSKLVNGIAKLHHLAFSLSGNNTELLHYYNKAKLFP